jgi:CO/xanthine dehydrogenase Mo-binding subunit
MTFQGRPHDGAAPGVAHGKVCYAGDPIAIVIAETRRRRCRRSRTVDCKICPPSIRAGARSGAPQIHEVAPAALIYQWHLDARRPRPRSVGEARHQGRHRQQPPVPNAMSRAHLRRKCDASGNFTLEYDPESAWPCIAAFVGMAPSTGRVVAPGAAASAEDFHLPRGSALRRNASTVR